MIVHMCIIIYNHMDVCVCWCVCGVSQCAEHIVRNSPPNTDRGRCAGRLQGTSCLLACSWICSSRSNALNQQFHCQQHRG